MPLSFALLFSFELVAGAQPKLVTPAAPWLGEQLPLALPVRSSEDLSFKIEVGQLYLLFNLVAGGKVSFDKGEYVEAAGRWEAALRNPSASDELKDKLAPWARTARERSGQPQSLPGASGAAESMRSPLPAPAPVTEAAPPAVVKRAAPPASFTVEGTVTGGGEYGPGGAVILLRRLDGATPRPRAGRVRANIQKDKRFLPHVLAVALGTTVDFRNEDEVFHNVFSLSKPNAFDLPLYKGGESKLQTFERPGPVQLLCNIHSSMQGWIYVSDTPYFAQADGKGSFAVKGVPPGDYSFEVWHEWSSKNPTGKVRVAPAMQALSVAVDGDKVRPAFVPDKSGKPRQPQLGY